MRGSSNEYPYLTGGFAEYVYVFPTSGRIKVPAAISDSVASAASCALRTVVHGFERLGRIDPGSTVVVLGSGPLGLFSVALAAVSGAGQVIVVGGPSRRLDLAKRWGATTVLDVSSTTAEQRVAAVLDATGGRGADVAAEMSGIPSAFNDGVAVLRRGGRYLVVGQLHTESVPFNPSQIVTKQVSIIGSVSADIGHYAQGLRFLERHASRFDWSEMITGRYSLDHINDAFSGMRTWDEIKPAILLHEDAT
jgi:threonine dehydrogenase-like Zn-dependent dehydrogenase